MKTVLPALLGAASLGILAYSLMRRKTPHTFSPVQTGPWDERDVDALARMLLIETSLRHDPDEMRGIIQVAINRARNHGRPLRDAVTPESSIFNWASGQAWVDKFHNKVPTYPQYPDAKAFVREYLSGKFPNMVGGSINMVHQNLMPLCGGPCPAGEASGGIHASNANCYTCANASGRECVRVPNGALRCLPGWMNEKNRIIYHVGEARFSAPRTRKQVRRV